MSGSFDCTAPDVHILPFQPAPTKKQASTVLRNAVQAFARLVSSPTSAICWLLVSGKPLSSLHLNFGIGSFFSNEYDGSSTSQNYCER